MATRQAYIIIGFDTDGKCIELGQCEPSNPVAEQLIADYTGPLVNLHWVTRDVEVTDMAPHEAPTDLPPPSPDQTQDLTIDDFEETAPEEPKAKPIPWPP